MKIICIALYSCYWAFFKFIYVTIYALHAKKMARDIQASRVFYRFLTQGANKIA